MEAKGLPTKSLRNAAHVAVAVFLLEECPDQYVLVGDAVVLTPGSQDGQKSTI